MSDAPAAGGGAGAGAGVGVRGVHHVAIIVSDLAAAQRFYCDLLGFAVVSSQHRPERDSWKVNVAVPGGVELELFTFPGAPARPSRPEAHGLRHLALEVADLDAAVAALDGAGHPPEAVRVDELTGRRFTFVADPDALPIELYEAAAPASGGKQTEMLETNTGS